MSAQQNQTEHYLSYQEASNFLGIGLNTLYGLVHKRSIPFIRIGPRFVRFSKPDLQQWLSEKRFYPYNKEEQCVL